MKLYNKTTNWGKVLIFIVLLILLIIFFKSFKRSGILEGFEQSDTFLIKNGGDIYDNFYANIYDQLVYNSLKNNYEIGQIVNKTSPSEESVILDIGSGTGHHVAELASHGYNVLGIDISPAMIAKATENYPRNTFKQGNVLNTGEFNSNKFTHITCLYFTIYYFNDDEKQRFFANCMKWLMPGGYLILHLVNREQFDPILPPGNPLIFISPQRYAKKRITNTKIVFNDFNYSSTFKIQDDNATFTEKFKTKNKVRQNEHKLYMKTQNEILADAADAGFIIHGKIDLLHCQYEYQYLYILIKPE